MTIRGTLSFHHDENYRHRSAHCGWAQQMMCTWTSMSPMWKRASSPALWSRFADVQPQPDVTVLLDPMVIRSVWHDRSRAGSPAAVEVAAGHATHIITVTWTAGRSQARRFWRPSCIYE